MASDALFLALANARAQPSKALRATEAAGQAGEDILGGYLQGRQLRAGQTEAKLKPYEIYTNIADKVGPDRANAIFKQIGMPVPQVSGEGSSGLGINTPPEQLLGQGAYGQKMLQGRNTVDEMKKRDLDMQNNAPYTPDVVRAVLKDNPNLAEGLISAHQGQAVPYREVQNAISTIRPNIMGGMVNLRGSNSVLAALPSHQGASTPAGAASGVQLASRQGRALIANPSTSPQQIALASGDLARAVLRAAPQLDAMRGADYSNTLAGRLNDISQRLMSGGVKPEDIPNVRQQMYKDFMDLENSSRPLIARELAHAEKMFGPQGFLPPDWEDMKKDEMGLNLPDIPFNAGTSSVQNPNVSTGVPQGKVKVSNGKQSYYIDPSDVPNAQRDGFTPQ